VAVAKGRGHPILNAVIRRRLIVELHKTHGYSMADARELAGELDDDTINNGIKQTEGATEAVGALGDGSFLQKILDFLASPQGQAMIALLIKILLGGM
jgi:hypothetical protein